MKRRHAMQKTGWMLSSVIFGPGLITALAGCATEADLPDEVQVFDPKQYQLAQALGDTILPRTESPSASDVKVTEFMDLLLRDVFEDSTKDHLLNGLSAFDHDCRETTGKSFADLEESARYDYLVNLDRETMGRNHGEDIPFYVTFKTLCVSIYYSTEAGIKQNLEYTPVPGGFEGDIALQPGAKIEVGNEM